MIIWVYLKGLGVNKYHGLLPVCLFQISLESGS